MSPRIHHIAIGAIDVERLAEFYRNVFDLPERTRHLDERGVLRSIWLDAGEVLLMIERAEIARERVSGIATGPFIVVFAVTDEERIEREGRFRALGVDIESRTRFTSYARDPEGNRVGVSTWPAPSDA